MKHFFFSSFFFFTISSESGRFLIQSCEDKWLHVTVATSIDGWLQSVGICFLTKTGRKLPNNSMKRRERREKKTHKKSVQTRSSLLNKRKMTTATTAKRYQDFYFDVEHALKVTVMEIYWLLLRRDWTISKISLKLDCFIRNCVYDFVRMNKAVVNQKSRQLKFLFNSELRVWRGWAFTKCSNHKWNWRS